jgi:hypothetical protein
MQGEPNMATTTIAMTCEIAEIEAHLRGQLRGRVNELRVVIRDDGLVLRGSSQTYHAKQLAQHGLMQATTVPLVANEIEVAARGSRSPPARNSTIAVPSSTPRQ